MACASSLSWWWGLGTTSILLFAVRVGISVCPFACPGDCDVQGLISTELSMCYTVERGSDFVGSFSEYLRPTLLCDFTQAPEIRNVADRLTEKAVGKRQMFNCIYQFVKEIPYRLEDWDVKASETLRKGWGMCSGKANLLVAMSRSLEIPARYRIAKIKAEGTLWKWIAKQNGELACQMGDPSPEQDHITTEVYLDGWEVYDPSRDSALERGLKKLHMPRRRELLIGADNNPRVIILASLDHWAQARQEARRFKEDRELILSSMNRQFDRIRWLGSGHSISS